MSDKARILFAIDFSEMTDNVIETAVRAAKGYEDAELHAVTVLDAGGHPLAPEADVEEVHRLERALQARIEANADAPTDAVTCHVSVGSVSAEISDLAKQLEADLIVVGRHGHAGKHPYVVGSAPARLLQLASCSVLVAQPKDY